MNDHASVVGDVGTHDGVRGHILHLAGLKRRKAPSSVVVMVECRFRQALLEDTCAAILVEAEFAGTVELEDWANSARPVSIQS